MEELFTITDEEFRRIVTTARTVADVDLTIYQPIILRHRLSRFAYMHGYRPISAIIDKLRTDKTFIDTLLSEIKTYTTEMFRDIEMWTELNTLISEKLKFENVIKIWIPDICGDDELNSLLILLSRQKLTQKTIIYASSHDTHSLEEAKAGIIDNKRYELSDANFKRINANNDLTVYTTKTDKNYHFSAELLSKVTFVHTPINSDNTPDKGFHLILYRNRLLYYNTAMRKILLEKVCSTLQQGGYLILGSGENPDGTDAALSLTKVSKAEKIYKKK